MIVFDEKEYAEKMIKKGFLTKKRHVYELNILSRYYFSLGKNEDEVKTSIISFCESHEKHFSIDEWYKIINKTITYAKKGKFTTGKIVYIYDNELSCISQIENLNEQKIVFVLLVLYKFYDYKKFEVTIEDLYKLAKLNLNSKTKLAILHSLTCQGLIDITMGGKRSVKFVEKKGNTVIKISDFNDFIYEYLHCIGDISISKCKICSKAIKMTNNKKTYCNLCFKDNRKLYNAEKQRQYRQDKKRVQIDVPEIH